MMGGWSEGGEWGLAKGYSLDVRKQMVQRVDGRLSVRGGVIMVRQNKAFLDHVFSPSFLKSKPGHQGLTHPILKENSITFFSNIP